MIIRRIKIKGFGCLDSFETTFEPGLNVIKGLNEAGKSTLHKALLIALLERPSKKRANEEYRAWGAEELYQLEIEYELPGHGHGILTKDFENNNVKLVKLDGESTTDWEEIQEAIEQAMGTCSLKIFKSTACVSQDELTEISEGRKEISTSLEEIVTGGEGDTYTPDAIAKLERIIQEYRRGYMTLAPKNPGVLAQFSAKQNELDNKVAGLRTAVSGRDEAQERLVEVEARSVELEGQLEPMIAARELADTVRDLQLEMGRRKEREESLDSTLHRIAQTEDQLAATETQLAGLDTFASLSDAEMQDMTRLHARVLLLETQKDEIERKASNLPPAKRESLSATQLALPGLLLLLGGAGLVLGIAIGILISFVPGAVVSGIGLFLAIAGLIWLVTVILAHRSRLAAETQPSVPVFDEIPLDQAKQELACRLAELNCNDWEDFEKKRKQTGEIIAAQNSARARLEGLLPSGKTKALLETERKEASRNRRDLEEKLNAPDMQRAQKMNSIEYQALARDIVERIKEQETLEAESIRLKSRFDDALTSREDLLRAQEELSGIKQEFKRAEERLQVYELALQTLQNARNATLVRAQDQLGPNAGTYLQLLTTGRYCVVTVDNELNVSINSPQKKDGPIEPNQLSKGTQDQLYLSLRLALVDLLFPTANPPIFMDDPFVKFDSRRKQAAIRLCQKIANRKQVFLFTCSSDYDQIGHIIPMGENRIEIGGNQN